MATVGETEVLVTKRGDVETGVLKENVFHVQSVGKETKYPDIFMETPTFTSAAVLSISIIENSPPTSISTICSMSTLWFS